MKLPFHWHALLDFLRSRCVPGESVTVDGTGTSRDPWRIKILDGTKDSKGNYFLFVATDLNVVSAPADMADAAATTRPSIKLTTRLPNVSSISVWRSHLSGSRNPSCHRIRVSLFL